MSTEARLKVTTIIINIRNCQQKNCYFVIIITVVRQSLPKIPKMLVWLYFTMFCVNFATIFIFGGRFYQAILKSVVLRLSNKFKSSAIVKAFLHIASRSLVFKLVLNCIFETCYFSQHFERRDVGGINYEIMVLVFGMLEKALILEIYSSTPSACLLARNRKLKVKR